MSNDSEADASPLTPAEEAFLADHGGSGAISAEDAARLLDQDARAGWNPVLEGALLTEQVADRLGVPPSQVRRLASRDALYCIQADVERFPTWQFSGSAPLPNLAEVLKVLHHAHPATVTGFMTLANEELDMLTPAQWLAAHRPAANVVRLAQDLFTW